jgi:thioredoxin
LLLEFREMIQTKSCFFARIIRNWLNLRLGNWLLTGTVIVHSRFFQCASFVLSTLFLVTSGCQQQPKVAATASPDGVADMLEISTGGEIEHVEAAFLSAVNRTDDTLVLVDFWAEWCGPCKMLAPELEEVKQDWGDRVVIVKVDVDANPEVAQYFQVTAIPDIRIMRNGQPVGGFAGYTSASSISARLKSLQ